MKNIIPVLIDQKSSRGSKIVRGVVDALETATKSEIRLLSGQEKKVIERAMPLLEEELRKIKSTPSCRFNSYKFIEDKIIYALFQLGNEQYEAPSSFEWSGDYHTYYRDSIALLTLGKNPTIAGIVPFVGSYYDHSNELLSEKSKERIRRVQEMAEGLDIKVRFKVPRCEGHTYLSDFAELIYRDIENKLKRLEERNCLEFKEREKATLRGKDLLDKLLI